MIDQKTMQNGNQQSMRSTPSYRTRRLLLAGGLFAALGPLSAPLSGQTYQQATTQKIDIGTYDFPEWCEAKIEYMRRTDYVSQGIYADTVEMRPRETLVPLRPPTDEFATRCGHNVPLPRLTAKDAQYISWIYVLLAGNRSEDTRALTAERIQRISEITDDTLRLRLLIANIDTLSKIQPAPFELLRMFSDALEQSSGRGNAYQRMLGLSTVMQVALAEGDEERSTHYASRMVALAQGLTAAEKELSKWDEKRGPSLLLGALDHLDRQALLDSLRMSTAGYLSLRRANAQKAFGASPDDLDLPIGKSAPELQGAFYFPKGRTDSSAIETHGKPPYAWPKQQTLLVFLDHACGSIGARAPRRPVDYCHEIYAALRRTTARFPGINLVIATQTLGYMGYAAPPSPAREAALFKQWWVDFQRIPAALVVEETDHWFLPGYDKRRIDIQTGNNKNYSFETAPVISSMAYLIDDQGTILHGAKMTRATEREWKDILTAYTSRQARGH